MKLFILLCFRRLQRSLLFVFLPRPKVYGPSGCLESVPTRRLTFLHKRVLGSRCNQDLTISSPQLKRQGSEEEGLRSGYRVLLLPKHYRPSRLHSHYSGVVVPLEINTRRPLQSSRRQYVTTRVENRGTDPTRYIRPCRTFLIQKTSYLLVKESCH